MGGVPRGARVTPVPDLFFSRVLPAVEDPVALEVALVTLWRIHRRPSGTPPALAEAELATDTTLARGLAALGVTEAERWPRLSAAVDQLVSLGFLLTAGEAGQRWLLMNDPGGRAALPRVGATTAQSVAAATRASPPAQTGPRPNIFVLYEDTIGLVTPMLAEELREAEAEYPPAWLERAFRAAADNNARRWSYVRAILERWARDGVDDEGHRRDPEAARERDSDGPYAAWIER
jgi:DnaD/phage-associated family protein